MNCSLGGLEPRAHENGTYSEPVSLASYLLPFDSWGHAPKPWRRAARRSIAPVSVWRAGEVKGAAAEAPPRTVLGRSRGSSAFQASETWNAPISMGLPESLQLFDETRVKEP